MATPLLIAAGPALNQLNDDAVRIELAKDGLGTLLERAFVVDNVPEAMRAPERAVIALRDLSDPKLTAQDRTARLRNITDGISQAIPRLNDPQLLLNAAALLVKQGVEQDVNVLEYFGEDTASGTLPGADTTKARLAPIVGTAVALYDRAVKLLDQEQSALQEKITRPGDEVAIQWQKVYQDFQTAAYTRWMLSYSQALSLDRLDKSRSKICDDAIASLAQWDTPDSGVQAMVRLQIGKLWMLRGTHNDLKRAREKFATFELPAGNGGVDPPADRFTIFNAKFFTVICDILDADGAAADRDAQAAEEYRASTLAGVAGDEYAMDMLHYRIALLKQDADGAVKILESLSDKAPGLRPIIAAQLLDKLPAHPDVTKLPPLMLSALVERGWDQLSRPAPDRAALDLSLSAADQYLLRADQADPQATPRETIDASKLRGMVLKAEGRPAEAAGAFLDHADRYRDDPTAQAPEAINEAIGQVAALYKGSGGDSHQGDTHQADTGALEDRLLQLAINSFRRYDLAYDYARRLQRAGQSAKAVDAFDLVPADDPNAFNAVFFKLVALDQRLTANPHDAANSVGKNDIPAVTTEAESLADQVIAQAAARQSAATDSNQKRQFQLMRVRAILLAAQIASSYSHDPDRTLSVLDGFEGVVAGLPDAHSLSADALNLRITTQMTAGRTGAATDVLLKYLNASSGGEGLQTVYNLLTELNRDLDQARSAGDEGRSRELADDRAALTPFLVKWAATNSNPDISKYTYRYRVFDAATQKQAAELETDPVKRTAKLAEAMARYAELQSPENVKLYRASLPADVPPEDRAYPDPQVTLGIGDVAYAMGNWKLAHDSIGQLLADSKLGDGTMIVTNAAGQAQNVDNDQFWEAEYRFIAATAELAKDPASGVSAETPRTMLARLAAVWQERIGGVNWNGKFRELARELGVSLREDSR